MSQNGSSNGVASILDKAQSGERIEDAEAMALLESHDLVSVGRAADELRNRKVDRGRVTFIIDRNVNYTNICHTDCDFCAFYRRPGDRSEGYLLPKAVIFKKIEETLAIGGTALLMQGGHHPDLGVDYYEDLFSSIKSRYKIHLHALSPPEVQHIARRSKLTACGSSATVRTMRNCLERDSGPILPRSCTNHAGPASPGCASATVARVTISSHCG